MEIRRPTPAETGHEGFEHKKTQFFASLGFRVRDAITLHQQQGLLQKTDGTRDWGNVTEHCLVEVARVEVLAELLQLPEDVKRDLVMAAAAHDALKREELKLIAQHVSPWQGTIEASRMTERALREAGFSERVVRLAESVALEPIPEVESILTQDEPGNDDAAFLVQHYVDAYTINNEWAKPAATTDDGHRRNDLDRRVDKNESNEKYRKVNEEGRQYFNGETGYEAQRRVGHHVEQGLSRLIKKRTSIDINPLDLPEYIDNEIRKKIEGHIT